MNQIKALLDFGYTAADILGGLSKQNKEVAAKINRALNKGYSASNVLTHLLGGEGKASQSKGSEQYFTQEQSVREGQKKRHRNQNAALGAALGLAAGGTAALLSKGALKKGGALALGDSAGSSEDDGGSPSASGSPKDISLSPEIEKNLPPHEVVEQFKKNAPSGEPKVTELIQEKPFDVGSSKTLRDYPHLKDFIKKHSEAGFLSHDIADKISRSKLLSPIVKKLEKESGMPILEIIKSMVKRQKISKQDTLRNVDALENLMKGMFGEK